MKTSRKLLQSGLGDEHRHCLAAHQLANQMAFARLGLETLNLLDDNTNLPRMNACNR